MGRCYWPGPPPLPHTMWRTKAVTPSQIWCLGTQATRCLRDFDRWVVIPPPPKKRANPTNIWPFCKSPLGAPVVSILQLDFLGGGL